MFIFNVKVTAFFGHMLDALTDSLKSASLLLPSAVPGSVIWFPPQRPSFYFVQSMMFTSALLHLTFSSLLAPSHSSWMLLSQVVFLSGVISVALLPSPALRLLKLSVLSFLFFFYQYSYYVNIDLW